MGFKFRPMKPEDYEENCVPIELHPSNFGLSLENAYKCGTAAFIGSQDSAHIRGRKAHVRTSYKLHLPVVNYVLAGKGGEELRSILGIKQSLADKLIKFKAAVRYTNGIPEIVGTEEFTRDDTNLHFGADGLRCFIKVFDAQSRFIETLNDEIGFSGIKARALLAYGADEVLFKVFHKVYFIFGKEGSIKVWDGVYLSYDYYQTATPTPEEEKIFESAISDKRFITAFLDEIYDMFGTVARSGESKLAKLYSLYEMGVEKAREVLTGYTLDYISILPNTFRPKPVNGKQLNPLDKLYSEVFKANDQLRITLVDKHSGINFNNWEKVQSAYEKLDQAVMYLMVVHKPKTGPAYKPIFDYISSKTGQVREYNLGKRQDFSGRSVIIVNPKMSVRNVGLPVRMIPTLYNYHYLKNNYAPTKYLTVDMSEGAFDVTMVRSIVIHGDDPEHPANGFVYDAELSGEGRYTYRVDPSAEHILELLTAPDQSKICISDEAVRATRKEKALDTQNAYTDAQSRIVTSKLIEAGIIKRGDWLEDTSGKKRINTSSTSKVVDDRVVPVVIGRQPTLHKGSISAFIPVVSSSSAMELSPLVCPGFNADFDGDQMYQSIPLSKDAVEEAKTVLLNTNNLFWAKDGAPLLVPRQEIIYGLNACTKNYDPILVDVNGRKKDTRTLAYLITPNAHESSPMEAAYNRILNNKEKVYQRTYTDSTKTSPCTVGQLAFKYCLGSLDLGTNITTTNIYYYICSNCGETFTSTETSGASCPQCTSSEVTFYYNEPAVKCKCCNTLMSVKDIIKNKPSFLLRTDAMQIFEEAEASYATVVQSSEIEIRRKELSVIRNFIHAYSEYLTREENVSYIKGLGNKIINMLDLGDFKELAIDQSWDEETLEDVILYNSFIKICRLLPKSIKESFALHISEGDYSYMYRQELSEAVKSLTEAYNTTYREYTSKYSKKLSSTMNDIKTTIICYNCGTSFSNIPVSKDTIKYYIKQLLVSGRDNFLDAIDKMVQLGFTVARNYAPTLSILEEVDYTEEFKELHEQIADIRSYFDKGFIEEELCIEECGREYDKLEAIALKGADKTKTLRSKLGQNNGFLKMVDSGARGSHKNLLQMYAFKGKMQKNSAEAFNAFIESSLIQQLTPLEHFTAAYGARRGIMDRSLETAKTGYLSRQMWQASQSYIISSEDCGTENGIRLSMDIFNDFEQGDLASKKSNIKKHLIDILVGRYLVGDSKAITKQRAAKIAEDVISDQSTNYILRSPLTCENPCCAKCYGYDMATHMPIAVGSPIGIVAAQSLGETISQLTMRTFQSGGAAGSGGITSDSQKATMLLHAYNVYKDPTYDPIAWADGLIRVEPSTKGKVVHIGDNPFSIEVPHYMQLKDEVKKGEGLCKIKGAHDLSELSRNRSFLGAQIYLAMHLFYLFSTYKINFKHFETMVLSMSRGIITWKSTSAPDEVKLGASYSRDELNALDMLDSDEIKLKWVIASVQNIPGMSMSPVANIDFEEIKSGLSSAILFDREDEFYNPIENMVFGLKPNIGTNMTGEHYILDKTSFNIEEGYLND